ncbi:MAG: hypothetical protein GF401_13565 [Chitinivibrionales bacterium]|nr:hypothetical protein [Chitinivibrionales bacterium]
MKPLHLFGIFALIATIGCDDGPNPVGTTDATDITTTAYQGMIYDSTMAAQMQPGVYNGSWFSYELSSNDSFTVQSNIGYGWGVVETGTWTRSGTTISFSPLENTTYGPGGAQPVTPVRGPYGGTLTGDTLFIDNYINITDKRSLGKLTCAKQ